MRKLSIIICVYNTCKEYFNECLKSIFNETLSDYEVIVVDDGSSVDYSDVLSHFFVKYVKTENRGLLEARLCGIELAEGKYISFVDSDDIVSLNYHQPMVDAAEKENADIVINDWAFMGSRICQYPVNDTTVSTIINKRDDDILLFYSSQRGREQSFFVQWNKLFKKELLINTKQKIYDEVKGKHITYAEDALMNFFNFKYAKKVVNVHTGLYLYRSHSAQSVVVANENQLKRQIDCMSFAFEMMENNCDDNEYKSTIYANVCAWRELMSRSHYTAAKLGKYTSLFPYIKEKYKVDVFKKTTRDDVFCYTELENIGENFEEIDSILTKVYYEYPSKVNYERKCIYVSRIINYIRCVNEGNIKTINFEISIPKRKISLKNKILYSPIVYRTSLVFFKKGSRARNFFKKLLLSRGKK